MKSLFCLLVALGLLSAAHQRVLADEKPSDLIVGKWQDGAVKNDAVIEFSDGGTGTITDDKQRADISWTLTGTYGNACTIVITYKAAKAAPLTWLLAFDGKDRFIVQPVANKIVVMERQK